MRHFTEEFLLSLKLFGELKLKEVARIYDYLDGTGAVQNVRQMVYYLTNKGYIQKRKPKGGVRLYLTEDGLNYINQLDKLMFPEYHDWNLKWRLLFFDIPEKKRSLRDKLRRELKSLGFGMLQHGVWFTPLIDPEVINNVLKKLKVEEYVILFSGKFEDFQISPELLKDKFKINDLLIQFKDLRTRYKKAFANLEKEKGFSFTDKLMGKIILRNRFRLELGKLINQLPPLPEKIFPDKKIVRDTIREYKKIQKHTTQELFKDRV